MHLHTISVTTRTLEKMYWEVLSQLTYSPDMVSSDFYLFSSLKEALGGKRFRALDVVKLLCNDGWTSNHKLFLKGA
jgi:hypothetical protein